MTTENIKVKILPHGVKPDIKNDVVVIKSPITISINPGEQITINSGLCVDIPRGYFGSLFPIHNNVIITGIIEHKNNKEIKINIVNSSKYIINFYQNDNVCELIIFQTRIPQIEIVNDF